jgi:hypothetical protein
MMLAPETLAMLDPPRVIDGRELARALDKLAVRTLAGIAHRCQHCGLVDERVAVGGLTLSTHPHSCERMALDAAAAEDLRVRSSMAYWGEAMHRACPVCSARCGEPCGVFGRPTGRTHIKRMEAAAG